MKLEFHSPKGRVNDWVLNLLKRRLIDFHIKHREIAKAQVYLREPSKTQKSCAIDLSIKGASLFVNQTANSFEKACALVMAEIENRLKLIFRKPEVFA